MARLVKRAGGDVVLFIKDNTPATRADLELFFEDEQADRRTWQSFAKSEKGHGRLERLFFAREKWLMRTLCGAGKRSIW
jgi:hypothetical protein